MKKKTIFWTSHFISLVFIEPTFTPLFIMLHNPQNLNTQKLSNFVKKRAWNILLGCIQCTYILGKHATYLAEKPLIIFLRCPA